MEAIQKPSKRCSFHICLKIIVTTLILMSFIQPTPTSASKVPKSYLQFIKTTCNTTTYPSLCYKYLSPYAASVKSNYLNLCDAAITVTIKAAKNTSALVSKVAKQKGLTSAEAAAIKDCIGNIKDSVDELQQTLEVMAQIEGPDREFQLSNAKTWGSAAITDESTCMDGLSERKVTSSVKKKVGKSILLVTRLNSNALYLINHIYH